jgi:hypothetical protein
MRDEIFFVCSKRHTSIENEEKMRERGFFTFKEEMFKFFERRKCKSTFGDDRELNFTILFLMCVRAGSSLNSNS